MLNGYKLFFSWIHSLDVTVYKRETWICISSHPGHILVVTWCIVSQCDIWHAADINDRANRIRPHWTGHPHLWGHNGTGADLMRPNPGPDSNNHSREHRFYFCFFVFCDAFSLIIFSTRGYVKIPSVVMVVMFVTSHHCDAWCSCNPDLITLIVHCTSTHIMSLDAHFK